MIGLDKGLLYRGGNQLGVLVMAAGLVAFFIDQVPGWGEFYLVAVGFFVYALSVLRWRPKPA